MVYIKIKIIFTAVMVIRSADKNANRARVLLKIRSDLGRCHDIARFPKLIRIIIPGKIRN